MWHQRRVGVAVREWEAERGGRLPLSVYLYFAGEQPDTMMMLFFHIIQLESLCYTADSECGKSLVPGRTRKRTKSWGEGYLVLCIIVCVRGTVCVVLKYVLVNACVC